jgi:hypothetical protein
MDRLAGVVGTYEEMRFSKRVCQQPAVRGVSAANRWREDSVKSSRILSVNLHFHRSVFLATPMFEQAA